MKFPSEICGENKRQRSEILNVIAPIAFIPLCIAATADFPHVTSDVTVAGSELCNIDNEKCLHDNQTPVQAANKLSIDNSQVESESHDEIT